MQSDIRRTQKEVGKENSTESKKKNLPRSQMIGVQPAAMTADRTLQTGVCSELISGQKLAKTIACK